MATAASTPAAIPIRSRSLLDYWHLLNLDAPTVATVWACALCIASNVAVPVSLVLLLALGTWLLYTGDRILDGIRPADHRLLRERHHFHRAHRRAFAVAALALMVGIGWLAGIDVSMRMLLPSCLVLTAACAYFIIVHRGGAATRRWFPKEIAVGIIFSAAVSIPAWSRLPRSFSDGNFLAVITVLAALFWLNCAAIESWESGSAIHSFPAGVEEAGGFHLKTLGVWSTGGIRYVAIAVMIASASALSVGTRVMHLSNAASIYLPVLVSAAILFCLDRAQRTLSPLRLRIAADFALLTPLLFFILPRLLRVPGFMGVGLR